MIQTVFVCAFVTTFFTRDANLRVFCDSSRFIIDGEIVHITETRAFPLSEFCKIRVNLESRNGICPLLYEKSLNYCNYF